MISSVSLNTTAVNPQFGLSRRQLLRVAGAAGLGLLIPVACNVVNQPVPYPTFETADWKTVKYNSDQMFLLKVIAKDTNKADITDFLNKQFHRDFETGKMRRLTTTEKNNMACLRRYIGEFKRSGQAQNFW